MKYISLLLIFALLTSLLCSCGTAQETPDVVATTLPVYEFTSALCAGTDIRVSQLVTEELSCLHDYTLQVHQMQLIESARIVVLSGGGLENFLDDALLSADHIIDASSGIELHCGDHHHEDEHHHENDPHIWLDPELARQMAHNICDGLIKSFPEHRDTILTNLQKLDHQFDDLIKYGKVTLQGLSTRQLITFHDGFTYFAEYFDLTILKAVEEESGSEASAKELIELIELVTSNQLPAIFTEQNGSTAAAQVIARETGISVYTLSMILSGSNYFDQMYENIDIIKEALK